MARGVHRRRSMFGRSTAVVAALAAALAAACTSTSTSVTAPGADKCQVSATAPSTFDASGGSGSVTISASRDCTWSIASNVAWVTITGSRSGQGDASVGFAVAANPAPAARTGAISVGSNQVSLSQTGAVCHFALSRASDAIGASGGRLSVDVSTLTGCSWTASVNASWIAIASSTTGNSSATVSLDVAANSGNARVGQLNVAGQIYTVNQDGVPPPAPSPTPPSPSPSPTPPPPSPPPHVSFSGMVSLVTGNCPTLSMTVGGRVVATDRSTKFQGIKCQDINPGTKVSIDGTAVGGIVNADTVSKAGDDGQN